MELGLGWSLSSDPAYGLAGIIALKLRPSAHAPVLLGVEGSTALLLWSDVFGFHVMGDLTLSIYPSRYFYFMLGGGINFLKFIREEEPLRNGATDFSSHLDEPLRNEAFGFNALLAIGMEFPITDPFRIGFQLRAQGGMYADNLFGMVASYLVFSFF